MIRIPILRNPAPGSPSEGLLHRLLALDESASVCKPAMDFSESEAEYHAYVALPGVDARSVRVAAVENLLIVQADSCRATEGNLRVSELPSRTLFRRIPLNEPLRLEAITAVLDRGLLHIAAAKASARRPMMAATA